MHKKRFQVMSIVLLVFFFLGSNSNLFAFFIVNEITLKDSLVKTELYFGLSIPGGGHITDEEWNNFIDKYITTSFPKGLTIIDDHGQWKSGGKIIKEDSRLIILFHVNNKESDEKIEMIREKYKELFRQESVLKVTIRAKVSF